MASPPNRLKELRHRADLTLQELAAKIGTTAPQVNKLERGERRMTIDWMNRLAPALGIEPKDLMPDPARPALEPIPDAAEAPAAGVTAGPAAARSGSDGRDLIPVRSAARGGNEQEMFLQDGPIDYVPRPPWLARVRDAYAIYMIGDSMWPRFRQGQLLHVNPYRPPQPGAGVVVTKTNDAVLIKEFVRRSPVKLVLQQYNPDMTLEFPIADIVSVDTVIGIEEP